MLLNVLVVRLQREEQVARIPAAANGTDQGVIDNMGLLPIAAHKAVSSSTDVHV